MVTKGVVSVEANNKKLALVLDDLLLKLGLEYSFDGNVVVIREAETRSFL